MIAIIDYNAGNVASVYNALNRLGLSAEITSEAEKLLQADKVIFPGVGRAGSAMQSLQEKGLDNVIPQITAPFLGICLGMQLLVTSSEEDETDCLSLFPGKVRKFPGYLKIPQIGWNRVQQKRENPLLQGIDQDAYFYFVHSYYVDAGEETIVATSSYGIDFPCILNQNNFYAVQFHPEKSGDVGAQLLKNFSLLCS